MMAIMGNGKRQERNFAAGLRLRKRFSKYNNWISFRKRDCFNVINRFAFTEVFRFAFTELFIHLEKPAV